MIKKEPGSATVFERSRSPLATRLSRYKYLYLMFLPALVFMIVFSYLPMYGIQIAFKNFKPVNGIWGSDWVGMRNFIRLFAEDTFLIVLKNTVFISFLKLFLCFPSAILFALMVNEITHLRYKKIMQTISYLPHFVSWVILSGILTQLLSLNGPINSIIASLGGERTIFLQKSAFFIPMLIVSDIWKEIGWGSIIYLAAIAGINREMYESSDLDGATLLQKMRYITLPSLIPIITIMFLMRVGHVLNAGFEQIFNLYNPLVYGVADIIDTYTYRVGLVDNQFSYSTAIGLFKNGIGVTLMLIVNNITKRFNEHGI